MIIPLKMEDFFNAEISVYSRAGFFIYLFKDFLRRTVSVDFSQICLKILYKTNKMQAFSWIKWKIPRGNKGNFYIKNLLLWEWHFHKRLCEEMIFPLPSGNFFTQKFVEMPHKLIFSWQVFPFPRFNIQWFLMDYVNITGWNPPQFLVGMAFYIFTANFAFD